MEKIPRTSKATVRELMELLPNQEDRDDMAIPSYLHANPLINYLFWKRLDVVYSLIPKNRLDTVMDYGCGIGSLLPALEQKASSVYGVDKRPQLARMFVEKTRLHRTQILGLEQFNSLPETFFDVIISADVLEHVDDLTTLLQKLRSQLKSNGQLIVSGPTENALYQLGRKIAGFSGDYHVRTIKDIDIAIEAIGFRKAALVKLPFQILPSQVSLFHVIVYDLDDRAA